MKPIARPPRPVHGARRRIVRVGLGALGGLVAWALIGVPLFVLPSTGPLPVHADAVVVLGPDSPQRLALAKRLYRDHVVGAMLWSTPLDARHDSAGVLAQCARLEGLTCFQPRPSTTQGEAHELAAQAEAHGWTSVIVVTQAAHVLRAGTVLARCYPGRITMAASGEPPQGGWAQQYLYQTLATVKLWLRPGC